MFSDFNAAAFSWLNGLAGRLPLIDYFGIFLADYLGYLMLAAAFILFLKEKEFKRRFYFFSLLSLSVLVSRGVVTEAVRFFYPLPRPFAAGLDAAVLINHSLTSSFPSGHAAFYFALALAVFFINRKWGGWFLAGAFLIGLARVFVGIHWPLDILAGAAVGLLSAVLIRKLLSVGY